MAKRVKQKTYTYSIGDGFMVDVVYSHMGNNRHYTKAGQPIWGIWLYHERYGIKDYMFGLPKIESPFVLYLIIKNNLRYQNYIESYKQEYMD